MRFAKISPLLLLVAACASPTSAEYLDKQQGYSVIMGYVITLKGLDSPTVEQLEDGTVYTVTQEGCSVLMEFRGRVPGSMRKQRASYDLHPGDKFIKSRPYSYILIKRGR